MREEVEARARRLLAEAPTRSMGAARLRERLVVEMGDRVAAAPQLARDLGSQPGFLVLDAPDTLADALYRSGSLSGPEDRALLERYRAALDAALAGSDTRIVLTDDDQPDDQSVYRLVARSVIALARTAPEDPELRRAMNAALTEAEQLARAVSASAGRSTIPPRDPPPRARSPQRAPRRSSRPPRTEECR